MRKLIVVHGGAETELQVRVLDRSGANDLVIDESAGRQLIGKAMFHLIDGSTIYEGCDLVSSGREWRLTYIRAGTHPAPPKQTIKIEV